MVVSRPQSRVLSLSKNFWPTIQVILECCNLISYPPWMTRLQPSDMVWPWLDHMIKWSICHLLFIRVSFSPPCLRTKVWSCVNIERRDCLREENAVCGAVCVHPMNGGNPFLLTANIVWLIYHTYILRWRLNYCCDWGIGDWYIAATEVLDIEELL